jgi:hypothetical protein
MTQLGKYDSDRDNILHFMCEAGWANESFGDVESPTGYVWRITNRPADVHIPNTEVTSLIQDQLEAYGIQDSPEFRDSLVGSFLVWEDSNGLVGVHQYTGQDAESQLVTEFEAIQELFYEWDSQDD